MRWGDGGRGDEEGDRCVLLEEDGNDVQREGNGGL